MPTNIATLPGVSPPLPTPLLPLLEIAYNFHWTFSPLAQKIFAHLDPVLWEQTGHNPVLLLTKLSYERLEALALDEKLREEIGQAHSQYKSHIADRGWYASQARGLPTNVRPFGVAYFCAEFGLTECFQIYSGGLGLLAGDHLKSASELGLPLLGVGLLYRNGYFHQALDATGYQQELFPALDAPRQPVRRVIDLETGRQLTVGVHMPGREVRIAVWRADVGKVPLYLLDTNIPENTAEDREITANLYLGDQRRRIEQEIVLGVGGVRALHAVGERPTVYHMNEGHAAFLAIERIREIRERTGLSFDQSREAASVGHLFTTHTPVPAGIDHFSIGLVQQYFSGFCDLLGLDIEGFMALGRQRVEDKHESFSMAVLALRTSKFCNGVSKLHGEVSRSMWAKVWPDTPVSDVPIGHVTNGVHAGSWLAPAMTAVYDKHLPHGWQSSTENPAVWKGVDSIPDDELWAARERSRATFAAWCAKHAGFGKTAGMAVKLDPKVLTIGFARRFAGYKRGTLLFRDPARLTKLLAGPDGPNAPGGMQLVLSGKSHPGDGWGKQLIREIVEFARSDKALGRIVFLEDYGIDVAREMVRGCDVWLNTPIRGLEASGTSGMKAAMNGVIHASILDGWWDEAYTPANGYKIEDSGIYPSDAPDEKREAFESDALYRLIERQIVPEFYQRTGGVPKAWTARMKACIRELAPFFNTNRMVAEYATNYYFPAHRFVSRLTNDHGDMTQAKEVADHIDRYRKLWHPVRVKTVESAPSADRHAFAVAASVRLGSLRPDEVIVQAYHGAIDETGHIASGSAAVMTCKAPLPGGDGTYHYTTQARAMPHAGKGYGVLVRVLPGDTRLVTPFIPGLISNSGVSVVEQDPGAGV